ncbi:MAG TPA: hypothetical protein VHT27_05310 [Solirubrobacteraceae bacterium]|nr:hypothetical protein [Solirubrobacteraceae bacterium]
MTTTREREARSVRQLTKQRERELARKDLARPRSPRAPRAHPAPEAREEFVRRVRSYLEVPRG